MRPPRNIPSLCTMAIIFITPTSQKTKGIPELPRKSLNLLLFLTSTVLKNKRRGLSMSNQREGQWKEYSKVLLAGCPAQHQHLVRATGESLLSQGYCPSRKSKMLRRRRRGLLGQWVVAKGAKGNSKLLRNKFYWLIWAIQADRRNYAFQNIFS